MKATLKIVSATVLAASFAQSAENANNEHGNMNPDFFDQSILMQPNIESIGNQILNDDIHTAIQLSLQSEQEFSKKDIEEQLKDFVIAESINEAKTTNQINSDRIFALQLKDGDFNDAYYDEDYLKAVALSLEENNKPKNPIEIKDIERPDIIVNDQLFRDAGDFLNELRTYIENKHKNDISYKEYYAICLNIDSEEELIGQLENNLEDLGHQERISLARKKEDLKFLKDIKSFMDAEQKITKSIDEEYLNLDRVKALMDKFNINAKNAQEILDALGM